MAQARNNGHKAAQEAPPSEEVVIGVKLREWRQSSGRTLTQLADSSGLSVGYISQIERGMANPSLEALKRLADVLGRTVGEMFIDGNSEPSNQRFSVTRRGQRKKIHYPGSGIVNELVSPDLHHQMEVIWVEAPPGATSGGHPHAHNGEECGFVIHGSMIFWAGDERITLHRGDSIYLDSTLPHRWRVGGDEYMEALWLISPPTF